MMAQLFPVPRLSFPGVAGWLQAHQLDAAGLAWMGELWESWLSDLSAARLDGVYLAVWLGQKVEERVDTAWAESPARGLLLHELAQALIMSAVAEILPRVSDSGCPPLPPPSFKLAEAAAEAGLVYSWRSATLARRFSVLTFLRKTGCRACHLRGQCLKPGSPKGSKSSHAQQV